MATGVDCCCETQYEPPVNIPGSVGATGAAGADGTDGTNAFTTLTANFTVPALAASASANVEDNSWASIGQAVFLSDGTDVGTFEVASKTGTTVMSLTFLGANGDASPGAVIGSGGSVSPAGRPSALSAALPTALTDNSTGTASNTIAAGVGCQTVAFYIEAATIANGDLLTTYVPGYAFKILKFDARCAKAVTTGSKASDLNLEIGTTNVTGGIIGLAGTYALGAAQAGSAITAANTGTASDSISIEASNTTAFVEGAFWLILEIQNMDVANAIASLSDHVNDLITSLTP